MARSVDLAAGPSAPGGTTWGGPLSASGSPFFLAC